MNIFAVGIIILSVLVISNLAIIPPTSLLASIRVQFLIKQM
jgi:hypothetical protein